MPHLHRGACCALGTADMTELYTPRAPVDRRIPLTSDLLRAGSGIAVRNVGAGSTPSRSSFDHYRFNSIAYVREKLGMEPWRGVTGCTCSARDPHSHPGQAEVLEAYDLVMRQQFEREDLEAGRIKPEQLTVYNPDKPIRIWFRVPGGHSTGKSCLEAMIACHFFDVYVPSVVSILAPKADQAKEQTLQEIKNLRAGRGLPGDVQDRVIKGPLMTGDAEDPNIRGAKHYIRTVAASNEGGKGGARLQGMHEEHQLIVLDEVEGIPERVKMPVRSWLADGKGIILLSLNPESRSHWSYTFRDDPAVMSMTLSSLYHPNVIHGRTIVRGVQRSFVEELLPRCKQVDRHDRGRLTFELPWMPGTIWEPDDVFSFRVLGEAPMNLTRRSLVSPAAFEAARKRGDECSTAREAA